MVLYFIYIFLHFVRGKTQRMCNKNIPFQPTQSAASATVAIYVFITHIAIQTIVQWSAHI